MSASHQLLAIIGRRVPAVYDVIPRGPQAHFTPGHGPNVMLNPQPIPPRSLGAAIADEFVHTAWLAGRFGVDPEIVLDDLDDWCPTGPHRLKPPHWWPPVHIPDQPHPDWLVDLHLGFATRLAVVAGELEGTRLGEVLGKAIDRSIKQALIGASDREGKAVGYQNGGV